MQTVGKQTDRQTYTPGKSSSKAKTHQFPRAGPAPEIAVSGMGEISLVLVGQGSGVEFSSAVT